MRSALRCGALLAGEFCGGGLFDSREQVCEGSSKGVGEAVNAFERNIPGATFDVGNVSSMQPGPASQFLLRNAQTITLESDCRTEVFFYIYLFHGTFRCSHN